MKALLQVTTQVSIQNNIQSSIRGYMKVHTQVAELTRDSMQTNIKSYILVTGQHNTLVNIQDSLKEQEHTLDSIQQTLTKYILVLTM